MLARIRFESLFSLFLILSIFACSSVNTINSHSNTKQESAVELLETWSSNDAPGVAVAVMLEDRVIFNRGYGVANLEHDIPIVTDTVFDVASVSKQFTAFATLLLVSEGKLKIDTDIRTYLPELQDSGYIVTIKHLLNHTGGFREIFTLTSMAGWQEDGIRTNEQYIDLLAMQKSGNFAPGQHVEYSNSGYFLLSQIIERVSGQPFQEFTKQRIFAPLEMHNTQFNVDRSLILKNRADSYYVNGEDYRHFIKVSENTGSTGLQTTSLDLLKWAKNFTSPIVGNKAVFDLMAERSFAADNEPSTLAQGQELRPYKGFQTWSHGGRDAGYRSFLLRIPEIGFAISILSNRSDFDTAKLAFALVDNFLSDEVDFVEDEIKQLVPPSSEQLNSYVGDYLLYPGIIFTISTDGSGLYFSSLNSSDKNRLPQIAEHHFNLNPARDLSIKFTMDDNGMATGFDYTFGLHGAIKATRVTLQSFDTSNVDLNDFTGVYFSKELITQYEFAIQDNQLMAKHLRLPEFSLTPYQVDTFSASGSNFQKAEFIRDAEEHVIGVKISGALANDVLFEKLQ